MAFLETAIGDKIRQLDPFFAKSERWPEQMPDDAQPIAILSLGHAALALPRGPHTVPYPGTIFVAGESRRAAQLGYQGQGDVEAVAKQTGVPETHVEVILNFVKKDIAATVRGIVERATDHDAQQALQSRFFDAEGYWLADDAEPLLVAALLIAESAHDGETRKDGQSYLSHVVASAALYQMAAEQVAGDWQSTGRGHELPDPLSLQRQMALNILHDVIEQAAADCERPSNDFFSVDSPTKLLLVVDRVIALLAPDDAETAKLPADMVALSKVKDGDLGEYYTGIVTSWRRALAKLCDVHHNKVINPKPSETEQERAKVASAHDEYDKLISKIERYLGSSDEFSKACAAAIREITPDEFARRRETLLFGHRAMMDQPSSLAVTDGGDLAISA